MLNRLVINYSDAELARRSERVNMELLVTRCFHRDDAELRQWRELYRDERLRRVAFRLRQRRGS
jgi:hypothetical protein